MTDPWKMPDRSRKDNVKNTNSGKINHSYSPSNKTNHSKNSKSKGARSRQSYVNARLTVDSIARLDAYQKINGMSNRSQALDKLLDKVLPKLNDKQKSTVHVIEDLFKKNHKGRSW